LIWAGLALAAGLATLAFFLGRGGGRIATAPGVAFWLDAPGASQVSLVGDFNNWDPAATPLVRVSDRGRWETVVPLTPGRYSFTFVVDGSQWVRDPRLPQAVGDDFGQPTSVITVPTRGRT
jgi:1,4-alpha-glucan branching enzyme